MTTSQPDSIPTDPKCAWHWDLDGWVLEEDEDPFASCGNCGMLIATKDCEGCGKTFIDWSFRGSDDVLSGPYATDDGDLVCERCLESWEEQEREREDDGYDDYDPYEAAGESPFSLPGGGKSL
jgi:hypothetical protein